MGIVVLAVAAGATLTLWLHQPDPVHEIAVQAFAAPVVPVAAPVREPPRALAVHFDYDRAVLRAGDAQSLDEWLKSAREYGFKRIDAVGHAGRIGSAAYNVALSQRRAEAVKSYLARRGVAAGIIRTVARGELEPKTGDACADMGPERRGNAGLVECLLPDRRVDVSLAIDS